MDGADVSNDFGAVLEVVDVRDLSSFVGVLDENLPLEDMTSLGDLMLLGKKDGSVDGRSTDEDTDLSRVSLAYERLKAMPRILVEELGSTVKILDISNNEFTNLDFLSEFKELSTLICDRNNITSQTDIPYMPKLELLWMNHCKIKSIHPWAKKLRMSCPNLKYLSLMGNPAAPSYLNGGDFYEYLHYRLYVISVFPDLEHLDDAPVTEAQRLEASREFRGPLAFSRSFLPEYLRGMSETVADFFTGFQKHAVAGQRNVVI